MRTHASDQNKQLQGAQSSVASRRAPGRVAGLHRSIGNRAVGRLAMTPAGDARERDADHAAARVTGHAHAPRRSSREPNVARTAPAVVEESLRSPGRPLDAGTRRFMESGLGADFSDVRVHTDAAAARSARAVGARAWTVGHDVVFGAGHYAPETAEGRHVLAHELAHVQQNRAGGPPTLSRYTLDDCEESDEPVIRAADLQATRMAGHAASALRQYRIDSPLDQGSKLIDELLTANFGFYGPGPFLDVAIKGYDIIHTAFLDDDYQYECEDDCSSDLAYVYDVWSDVHLCMNKLRGKTSLRISGVMLHEMSHYAAGTADLEYFYPGFRTDTSLSPYDAVSNADSYEGFAEELYKFR